MFNATPKASIRPLLAPMFNATPKASIRPLLAFGIARGPLPACGGPVRLHAL
jgi:hypothetical protein